MSAYSEYLSPIVAYHYEYMGYAYNMEVRGLLETLLPHLLPEIPARVLALPHETKEEVHLIYVYYPLVLHRSDLSIEKIIRERLKSVSSGTAKLPDKGF